MTNLLAVARTVVHSPEAHAGACDKLNIHFHYLLEGEIAFLSNPSYQTLKKLWDTAAKRGKSKGSGIGVTSIPIELFNTSVSQRPFETWKDPEEWTPFVYRPGVEDKAAVFKPESSAASTGGAFGALWRCKMKIIGEDKVHEVSWPRILQRDLVQSNTFVCDGLDGS
ncbi:hypothetical protein FRC00_004034 [Tulasnella sp. 408]|nr:hypothetical protein FRC00_004034 [Tulasnella sp. 408]